MLPRLPIVERSSAFILHSSMIGSRNATAGISILHVVLRQSLEEDREPYRVGPWDNLIRIQTLPLLLVLFAPRNEQSQRMHANTRF